MTVASDLVADTAAHPTPDEGGPTTDENRPTTDGDDRPGVEPARAAKPVVEPDVVAAADPTVMASGEVPASGEPAASDELAAAAESTAGAVGATDKPGTEAAGGEPVAGTTGTAVESGTAAGEARDEPRARRRPALSPSRAGDFKQCPLLYRFRVVDRLPETPSPVAVRGTVVHSVLERLFALPAHERVPATAQELLEPAWRDLQAAEPELAAMFDDSDPERAAGWLESARGLLDSYFALEDPRRLAPEACELFVETELEPSDDGEPVLLRGYIDRLDVAPTGEIRVVDYKTGAAPREIGEARALFQMKFYAVVLWRLRGVVPRQLRLMYLADEQLLSYTPDEAELRRFERTLAAIWTAILRAGRTGDFRPHRSRMCDYCSHQALCPEFGGTPPPYPGWPTDGQVPDAGQETPLDRAE